MSGASAAPARPRVLCVDDEPAVLEGLGLHLRRKFEMTTAGSGAQALALLAAGDPPDVVVSDMRMPGMDGAALLTRVRELYPSGPDAQASPTHRSERVHSSAASAASLAGRLGFFGAELA